jgi:tetratricopeptide (TPR) repeat protein
MVAIIRGNSFMFQLFRRVNLLGILCAVGFSTPALAKSEWWEARTAHFVVVTQDSEANARAYAEKIERFDNALRLLQNMAPKTNDIGDANRVTIYRFGDDDDIGGLIGSSSVAGFYKGQAGNSVAFVPVKEARESRSITARYYDATNLDAVSVLKHEYVHHFMLSNFPASYPGWYVEGFAEVFATLDLRDDGSYHVGNPPNYRAHQLFNQTIMPTGQLFNSERQVKYFDEYIQRYSLGWLLTHYLSFSKDRAGQLHAYLTALGNGEKSLEAANRIFGDLGKLDKDLWRHLRNDLPGIDVKPNDYKPPVVTLRRIEGAEADTMPQRIRLQAGIGRKAASGLASALEEATRRWPEDPRVWTMLAEAQTGAKNYDAADVAADTAMRLDPKLKDALLAKADIAIMRERKQPGSAAKARPFLVAARRIDERDPRALIAFYMTYREARVLPPESSLVGLETAFETSAHDQGYRYVLGMQLLSEGKGSAAKSVLLPISVALHGMDPKKNKIAEAIGLVDAGKVADAHALLVKEEEDERKKAEEKEKD